jgi:ThiF family
MSAFTGGVLAQEVVKCTGKFTPIPGFMHFSAPEVLPDEAPAAADTVSRASRYDEIAAVFGWPFVEQLGSLKYFMVGCGALGCEFMKNFALNNICCGPEGQLIVTDADRIELSNLSRQFLFREHNVGQPKSIAASMMATVMNPGFKVKALEMFVGPKTEVRTCYQQEHSYNASDDCSASNSTIVVCRTHSMMSSGVGWTECAMLSTTWKQGSMSTFSASNMRNHYWKAVPWVQVEISVSLDNMYASISITSNLFKMHCCRYCVYVQDPYLPRWRQRCRGRRRAYVYPPQLPSLDRPLH